MPAYMLGRVTVSDPEQYKKYAAASTSLAPKYGGRFIVRGGQSVMLEGPAETRRLVVIEFPDAASAKAWYESPEYQAARQLRVGASEAEFLVVEGV